MSHAPCPPEAATFAAQNFPSAETFDVLCVAVDAPDVWWDPRGIGLKAGIPTLAARVVLDRLADLNILDVQVTDEIRYRFQPLTRELGNIARAIVAAYRAGEVGCDG